MEAAAVDMVVDAEAADMEVVDMVGMVATEGVVEVVVTAVEVVAMEVDVEAVEVPLQIL